MKYVRLITVLLVMFGLAACGGTTDDVKKENEGEIPVIVIDDDEETTSDETTPDNSSGDGEVVVTVDPESTDGDPDTNPRPTPDEQVCGNGILDADEACDDGNAADKDGCSAVCEIETVVLRNLEAVLEDSYSCYDDLCSADYRMTMTMQNFTDQYVDRVTNVRISFGGVNVSTGGVQCEASQWQIAPESRSNIIDIELNYDRYDDRYKFDFDCYGGYESTFYSSGDYNYFMESGQITFEITGLLEDGAVWTTAATTDLRDFR